MQTYLPSRDDINPSWFERWGETFDAPELATLMIANDRIFETARERMFEAFGIDPKAQIKQEDIITANIYAADRERLARICGMVIHGNFLRTRVSKSDFQVLANTFSVEDLRIATSLGHLHPPQSEFNSDMAKIETLIENSGKACIHGWKTSLEEQIGMRIYLMETQAEQEEDIKHTIDAKNARAIVIAVSIALKNDLSSLAA